MTETAEKVKEAWEDTEDKPAVVSLGAFAFVGLWAVSGLLKGLESLPFVATFLELVGIAFSSWFVYRYLLFKPDRCASLAPLPLPGAPRSGALDWLLGVLWRERRADPNRLPSPCAHSEELKKSIDELRGKVF